MDIVFLDSSGYGFHSPEYCASGDTRPDADAGAAECVVHSACDRVYVLVFTFGLRFRLGTRGHVLAFARCAAGCGYPYIYRCSLPDFRYAVGCALGEAGVGTLLGLGSEGDMGPGDMAGLCVVYASEGDRSWIAKGVMPVAGAWFRVPADVLVGHQLPANCPGQYTYI